MASLEQRISWLSELCVLAGKWRASGFTHIVARQTPAGTECYVFPASVDRLAHEERLGCVLVIPLETVGLHDLAEEVAVFAGVADSLWVFNGRKFARPAELQ